MTETQPDPQVVAWHLITGWSTLCGKPSGEFAGAVTLRVDQVTCPDCRAGLPKPLTLADIPAGQGAASLFILSDDDGQPGAWHKDSAGRVHAVYRRPFPHYAGDDALWDHLAATLPTVTDKES